MYSFDISDALCVMKKQGVNQRKVLLRIYGETPRIKHLIYQAIDSEWKSKRVKQRKQSRDANVIIHSVKEIENENIHDFVKELLEDVNIKIQPAYVFPIGKECKI